MTPALKSIMAKATKKTPTLIQDVEQAGILRKIPVDSPQLLYQFGGGITVGRMHRFRGPESSGKSSICNYISGQLQKHMPGYEFPDGLKIDEKQKIVVYVDFERSFDMKHATENGLDCSEGNFIYLTPDTIEDATDILVEMIPTGEICAVIFDSDASAPTRTQMADEAGKASFGAGAKALGEMLRKLNILCANYRTTLLYISQERAAMNAYSHLPAVTGGEAPKFYASTVNRITKTDVIKQGNETVGIEIRVRNYKNKCGIPFRDANMKLYYKDSFRPHDEYVQFLIDLGVVEQKGAYFKSEKYGFSLQGRAKLQEWLDANPEEYEKLKVQVNEMLIGYTILDKDNVAVSENENDPLSAPGIDTSKGFSDDDIIVDEPEEQAPLAKRKTAEQKAEELASMALATTEVVEEEKTSNESSDDVIIDE